MQVIKCSASAIDFYRHCSFAYFMKYILGMEYQTGKAAIQGNIVHKTFNWMSKLKKRNKTNIDPMFLLDRSWDKHIKRNPHLSLRKETTKKNKDTGLFKEAADFRKCRLSIQKIIDDKFYNPYNLNIINSEQWFGIEMPGKEWQCYDQNGCQHQFTVRGFIDLIHEIDHNTIEIIDWKTGIRKDLYIQEDIDESILLQMFQPRLYHMAAYILYPQYKDIIITFYYINDGGPISIPLSQDDIEITISALYRFFEIIRADTLMRRNKSWKCRMCSFNNNGMCQRVWSDLHTLGGEYVEDRYRGLSFKEQLTWGS